MEPLRRSPSSTRSGPEPWRDPRLPADVRVADLLDRMTVEEKAGQLVGFWAAAGTPDANVAPNPDDFAGLPTLEDLAGSGVGQLTRVYGTAPLRPAEGAARLRELQALVAAGNRFGIPAIAHEECLTGFMTWSATIFPCPLAWGATFDPALVEEMAAAIAATLRRAGVHQGLAPVLDVVRDPRWGRTEETIGEDPYLVGRVGTAYVRGLERSGVVATVKHFAGYASARAGRNMATAALGPRELADVIVEPFVMALRDGGARSVMHSYADVDGVPAAADERLLTHLLRDELGFTGVVVSDYFGISHLETMHAVAETPDEAATAALHAGVDQELPTAHCYGAPLAALVRTGELPESHLDRAAARVLTLKCTLGLLDAPTPAPPDGPTADHAGPSPAAAESPDARPTADHVRPDGPAPAASGTPDGQVAGGHAAPDGPGQVGAVRLAADGRAGVGGMASGSGSPDGLAAGGGEADDGRAGDPWEFDPPEYRSLARRVAERSVVLLANDGTLPLRGGRVVVAGPLGDDPRGMLGCYSFPVHMSGQHPGMEPGVAVPTLGDALRAELGDDVRVAARARLPVSDDDIAAAVSAARDADVCVLALGDHSGMFGLGTSGEGCDAASLRLPGRQFELATAVLDTGTPTVVVMLSGRPYALGGVADRAAACVQAFFPGEEGGTAVAGVLSGRVSPAGRLPVSVPRHSGGQPGTYLHPRTGEPGHASAIDPTPLYPFGHGLTWTRFAYDDLDVDDRAPTDGAFRVSATVRNIGDRPGTETVQLYLSDPVASVVRPVRWLAGWAAVPLAPGASARVEFTVHADRTSFTGRDLRRRVEPGTIGVAVGPSSTDLPLHASTTLTGPVRILDQSRVLDVPAKVSPPSG